MAGSVLVIQPVGYSHLSLDHNLTPNTHSALITCFLGGQVIGWVIQCALEDAEARQGMIKTKYCTYLSRLSGPLVPVEYLDTLTRAD